MQRMQLKRQRVLRKGNNRKIRKVCNYSESSGEKESGSDKNYSDDDGIIEWGSGDEVMPCSVESSLVDQEW